MNLLEALAAVEEPQIGRSLGELAFLGDVNETAKTVELLLPVTNWPNIAALRTRIAEVWPGSEVVIRAMNETGKDMLAKYKETSEGGLALQISVAVPAC